MYYVLTYRPDADGFARAPEVYPRHRALAEEMGETGDLWLIGTFADPRQHGSMAVFRRREAAEQFAARDPFVLEHVVLPSDVLEWDPLEFASAGRDLD